MTEISIIVPNLHSPIIDRVLAALKNQTFDMARAEILVIGLDRYNLVAEDERVRFIRTEKPVTAPVARNMGIQKSKGEVLAFVDADCIVAPDWLEKVMDCQARGIPIVSGSISLRAERYWELCYNLTMFHEFLPSMPPGERRNLPTLNLCVARSVIDRVGLLDETLPRCQDTEWTCRMRQHGYALYFAPQAQVTHLPDPKGLQDLLWLWFRSGFYSAKIRKQYRHLLSAPAILDIPWLTVLLAPLAGVWAAARVFQDAHTWRYLYTFPIVYLTKVMWCLGAARQAMGAGAPGL